MEHLSIGKSKESPPTLKTQRDIKDISLKYFFKNKERLADLLNYYLYGGKQAIHATDIFYLDTEYAMFLGERTSEIFEAIKKYRDVVVLVKLPDRKNNPKDCYIIVGLENQSKVDYRMLFRIYEYNYLTYKQQTINLGPDDAFYPIPVVTLVLYCGDRPWNKPKSLFDMMKVHEDVRDILDVIHCLVIDIRDIDIQLLHNEENKKFIEIVQAFYNGTLDEVKCPTLPKDVAILVAVLIGEESFLSKIEKEESEEIDMCQAFKRSMSESMAEGEARGREMGRSEGEIHGKAEAIKSIMQNLKYTFEQAVKVVSVPESEYETYRSLIAA